MGVSSGKTSVIPGAGIGLASAGEKERFSKYVPGTVNPRGVGTGSGFAKTSIATVVFVVSIPGGNVIEALEPKLLSVTVPPPGPTVPSGISDGLVTTMLLGNPMD